MTRDWRDVSVVILSVLKQRNHMSKMIALIAAIIALGVATGPAPNSGDGVSDGSGMETHVGPQSGNGKPTGPAPNSGDGIPDGSGF